MYYLSTFRMVSSRADEQIDPLMIQRHTRLSFSFCHGQQVASTPEMMALALDKLPGGFPRLRPQLLLLIPNPLQFRDRVSTRHFQPRTGRCSQSYPAIRRMNAQVNIFDRLTRNPDGNFAKLNGFCHW